MQNGWILQEKDLELPAWVKDELPSTCSCGAPMANFYNAAGKVTARKCTNESCPKTIGRKIEAMCDILKMNGIGYETGLRYATQHKMKSHFEAVPLIWSVTPTVTLYQYLRCCFIPGVDTRWAEVAEKCDNIDDVFSKYKGQYAQLLKENEQLIREGAEYFEISESWKPAFEPLIRGTVMMSSEVKGFANRENFIAGINQASEGLISLNVINHKRQSGVLALIQEADSPRHSKYMFATENGIPVMTPADFQNKMLKQLLAKLQLPENKELLQKYLAMKGRR